MSADTIADGLKEALAVGARNAAEAASSEGAYSGNPALRIALPEKLQPVADALRKVGLGGQVDILELKMNQAAEEAAAGAAEVFVGVIQQMTFEDARAILAGGDTAATDYLREKTYDPLKARYAPIVQKHMNSLGAVRKYKELVQQYEALPFTPKVDLDIENYVSEAALDGLFKVLAGEERKIRENPAARTTELLRKVFGTK